uniref:Major facilitator superfamily (MFS) profile domain-containing protein n=1 Tax=Timema bartmani TaxID=61472 RepID=A0A7R9I6P4_9NEOP|nr:unnamed protein product [Timema bartmani]
MNFTGDHAIISFGFYLHYGDVPGYDHHACTKCFASMAEAKAGQFQRTSNLLTSTSKKYQTVLGSSLATPRATTTTPLVDFLGNSFSTILKLLTPFVPIPLFTVPNLLVKERVYNERLLGSHFVVHHVAHLLNLPQKLREGMRGKQKQRKRHHMTEREKERLDGTGMTEKHLEQKLSTEHEFLSSTYVTHFPGIPSDAWCHKLDSLNSIKRYNHLDIFEEGNSAPAPVEDTADHDEQCRLNISTRLTFGLVACSTVFIMSAMGSSVPVAIIAMVKPSTSHLAAADTNLVVEGVCPERSDAAVNEQGVKLKDTEGEFDWDEITQSYIMTAGGYGSLATNLIGARLAEVYGPRLVCGTCVFVSGVLSLLIPVVARWNVWAFIVVRVVQGGLMGPIMPGFMILFASWVPPSERGHYSGIIFSAVILGSLFSMLVSGNLATYWGWESIFYFYGFLKIPFCVVWVFMMYDSPLHHPRISEEEKDYIVSNTKKDSKTVLAVPWLKILLSAPVWAVVAVNISVNWVSSTLQTELPIYMRNLLHFNINQVFMGGF